MPVDKLQEINILHRDYQQEYLDYWNSTATLTTSGRPVDAIITPILFFAASEPGKTNYLGEYRIV
jgi:amidase